MGSKEIEKEDLPYLYRLLLKFPVPSLERFPSVFHGLFYAVVLPLAVVCYFLLTLFLLVLLPPLFNYLAVGLITISFSVFFLRIHLERFINAWNSVIKQMPQVWDMHKSLEEYMALVQEKKSKEK